MQLRCPEHVLNFDFCGKIFNWSDFIESVDIVKPTNNELELITMAERLGIKTLGLLETLQDKVNQLQKNTSVKLMTAGPKGDIVIKEFGKGKAQIVFGLKEPLKHAQYKELAEAQTAVCFPFRQILNYTHHEELDNVIKNIRLCRQHKVKIATITLAEEPFEMRRPNDLKEFYRSLGMSTEQVWVNKQ